MQLEVRQKGIAIDVSLRERIVDHIEAALRRFARRIRDVTICVEDANGPRRGLDKHCQIAVRLDRGGTLRSGRTEADLIAAIHLATDRVTHAVGRRLERRRKRALRMKSWRRESD
jgi:ribosome-associated translation inhibitor RaiA